MVSYCYYFNIIKNKDKMILKNIEMKNSYMKLYILGINFYFP